MHVRELERKLKKIKPGFSVLQRFGHKAGTAEAFSGLYLDGTYLFAIPLNEMPEYTVRDIEGAILIRGWKHVAKNLVQMNKINRRDVERVFKFVVTRKLIESDRFEPSDERAGRW